MIYINLEDLSMSNPKYCDHCRFCHEKIPAWKEKVAYYCVLVTSTVQDVNTKPKWCPIKEEECTQLK